MQRLFQNALLTLLLISLPACQKSSLQVSDWSEKSSLAMFHEPFEYASTNRSLTGLNGGFGFFRPWRHQVLGPENSVVRPVPNSETLRFPGLKVSGGSCRMGASGSMHQSVRPLPDSVLSRATNGAVLYLSCLIQPEGNLNEGYLRGYFVLGLIGTKAAVVMGRTGGGEIENYVLEQQGGAGQVASRVQPKIGETALLVMKLEIREGADRFTLFVNPSPGQTEPASNCVKEDLDVGMLDALQIHATGAHRIDEIRMGSSFQSVTPVN